MKIAIIAHSHYPIKQPFAGGLEAHTYSLTQQLQASGHEVTLFSAMGSDENLAFVPFCEPTASELSKTGRNTTAYRERRYLSLMRVLKRGKYDIVHNNSLHYVPLQLASSLPIPMVTVLHTPPFDSLAEGFRASLSAPNHRIIAISNSVAQSWRRVVPGLKSCLIYNGVDTAQWQPTNKPQGYAIWVGRIIPDKGLHLAIKAAQLANIPLKICGPIHDVDYFSRDVEPLLGEQAVYLKSLGNQALAEVVARASVLVCTPCWDEPFGLVAAEALSSGTPIAGFNRGGLTEVVTPETGVLVSENVGDLAQAIERAQQLSREKCRQRAVKRFSLTAMVQGYMQLYQTLLSDRIYAEVSALPLVS